MAKSNAIGMNLPSVDDMFSTQAERDQAGQEAVRNIPLEEISDFPGHPFKVKLDENMMDMAESVKQYGVLVPALVREKKGGGYEMIAGHRRKMASELAEKQEIPCIVRNLSDDEAVIIMVDSNLQREEILPSEKAFAYKMKLEAMNRQGERTDLTSTPVVSKLRTNEILAKQTGKGSKGRLQKGISIPFCGYPLFLPSPFPHPTPFHYQPKYQPKKKIRNPEAIHFSGRERATVNHPA